MKLILIRHGESRTNVEERHQTFDDPLTLTGIEQIKSIRINGKIDKIYSSDMPRAINTAKILFPNSEIQIDKRIREKRNGIFEGTIKKETDWSEVNKNSFLTRKAPSGENLLEVITRTKSFLKDLPEGNHVIISHGTLIRVLISILLDINLEKLLKTIQIENGSVISISTKKDELKKL